MSCPAASSAATAARGKFSSARKRKLPHAALGNTFSELKTSRA
jgi:hypothetical protein